jgi:VanZ family protein
VKLRTLLRWIPAVFIMAVIFYFSSQPYHQQDLRPKLHELLPEQRIIEQFSSVEFNYAGETVSIKHLGVPGFVEFFIRKGAHFFIYWLLGFSVAYALISSRFRLRYFLFSVLICALYASTDEFHQFITGDRTPLITDVGIDTLGAAVGVVMMVLLLLLFRRSVNK